VNRRAVQVFADRSISELWAITRDHPGWRVPNALLQRAFVYPLGVPLLVILVVPLVLVTARFGTFYGVSLALLTGVGYYGALIALTGAAIAGWGAAILWLGQIPFVLIAVWLRRRMPS
jgi:lipopolysaccharide export LptBFGC system permease protein LptF